jgi:LEA14-like dessication related protein
LGLILILVVLGAVGVAYYQSYTSLQYELGEVSIKTIDWKPESAISSLLLVGGPITIPVVALSLISSIKSVTISIGVTIRNNGFVPVTIPSFDYTVTGNGAVIGPGTSRTALTIMASSRQRVNIEQTIPLSNIAGLVSSILGSGGKMELQADGKARLSPLPVDLPFRVSGPVDVYQMLLDVLGF